MDATLKKKATKLLRKLEELPDDAWDVLPMIKPEERKRFVNIIRIVAEGGVHALLKPESKK